MKSFLKIMTSASFMLLSASALAQDTQPTASAPSVAEVVQRYPAGSIQSTESADEAIKTVAEARAQIERRHLEDRQACYPKFFTTACLDKATERRRQDMAAVRPIELEANSYIRHARVAERDRRLEEAAKEREAKDATRSSVPVPQINDTPSASDVSDAQRAARAQAHAEKNAERARRERERQASAAADAQKRAENVERYEEKQRESLERQKEVERRKAEREGRKTAQ